MRNLFAIAAFCLLFFGALAQEKLEEETDTVASLDIFPEAIRVKEETLNEDYSLPKNLAGEKVYFEKFSQIYLHDLNEEINNLSMDEDSVKFRSSLVNLISAYNKLYYRKFNEYLASTIETMEIDSHIVPIYKRDLREMNQQDVRFVVRNEINIVEGFLTAYENDDFQQVYEQKFYLYDKKTGTKYLSYENMTQMLMALDLYYALEQNGLLDEMDKEELEQKISAHVKPVYLNNQTIAEKVGSGLFTALTYLGSILVVIYATRN